MTSSRSSTRLSLSPRPPFARATTPGGRILGARDVVTERTGVIVADKSVRDLRDQAERDARARLGQERWAPAYAAGRIASIDSLLKDIESALT